jgi:DnaD/phage-associated family protein
VTAPSVTAPSVTAPSVAAPAVTVTRAKTRLLDEIPNYTMDELEKFMAEQQEAAAYLNECQAIWGAMFNTRDYSTVITLVNVLGLSWDYILTLLAYAAKYFKERDNQGKSLNFVYRMASNYHREGIVTDEALRQKFVDEERMKDFEHRLRGMFGLGERNLTPKEKKFFSTWRYEYRYGMDVIEMAYNIAVDTKGSPQMSYINGILKHWYEDGLTTVEAITARREQDSAAMRGIKEGKLNPDNAREAVEGILAAEADPAPARGANMAQDIGILRRLLGLGNRMITDGETAAFTKWRVEFGLRYEVIYLAYQITLENRREYSLPYMDAILSRWHARKLTTLEDIKAYEQGFKEERERDKAGRKPKPPLNAPAQNSSFDTNEFFMAAVKRSFGDDFDPSILEQ